MANRTISLITYATDGSVNTSVTPAVTVSYGGAAASALTPTANGNYWNVTIDDTQDATLLIGGTGLTADHLVFPRIPEDRLADTAEATSILGRIASLAVPSGTWADYSPAYASQTSIRQRGDTAWTTGSGAAADTAYMPTSASAVAGTASGTYADLALVNGTYYTVNESTVAPYIDARIGFTVTDDVNPATLRIWGRYQGGGGHSIVVQAAVGATWETIGSLGSTTADIAEAYELTPEHLAGGAVTIRFLHAGGVGIATHNLYLDKVELTAQTNVDFGNTVWTYATRALTDKADFALSAASRAAVVDETWDEVLTGATHNVASSAGRRLRQLAATIITDGIAQSGGTNGNQIQLAAGSSAVNGAYDPALIAIVLGTGAGQARNILEYNGTTKTATVDRDWKVVPDATSEYIIYADAGREHVNEGLAQAGAASSITLNANASAADGAYIGEVVFLRSGTGADQARRVTAYNGTTKVATVDEAWAVTPDGTTAYVMLPTSRLTAANITATVDEQVIAQAVDAQLTAAHGSGTWGSAAPGEWVTIDETTLDDSGIALGPMDAPDILLYAIDAFGTTVDIARSQGDGGFELTVPPSATYTIRAYRVGYSYDDRTVTV